jgi:1-acyl-sn-glycerol-3-phosphate acyltransferase
VSAQREDWPDGDEPGPVRAAADTVLAAAGTAGAAAGTVAGAVAGTVAETATGAVRDAATAVGVPLSPRRPPLPDVPMRPRLYHAMRMSFRRLFPLMFDLRVEHADRVPSTGPVLLAGNHRGFLDAPLVAAYVPRPASFLAKSELFYGAAARPLMWLGQIPVDRGRADREALRRAVAVLAAGQVLGMFPEGTRGPGSLASVQHGIAYVALRCPGVPIVPVACIGTEHALPMGAKVPRWRARVDVVFGEPFTVSVPENPRARRAVAAAAEEIRVALAAHVAAAEAEVRRR